MLLLYLCNIQIRYLHPIIMFCHILLYLLISSLSTLRFGPRWAKVPWTFSASQPPLNPSRPCQVSHSHDSSLRGVWTINIQSLCGTIAPDECQIIGQSTENQPVRSRKHIHSLFDLKIAIFSTALVLGNRSMCLFLLYNAGAQIFQSPQDFALRE